jgi:hypothetical protein
LFNFVFRQMPEPTIGICIETTDRKAGAPTMSDHVVFTREKTLDKFELATYSKDAPASGREVPHIVSAIRC